MKKDLLLQNKWVQARLAANLTSGRISLMSCVHNLVPLTAIILFAGVLLNNPHTVWSEFS